MRKSFILFFACICVLLASCSTQPTDSSLCKIDTLFRAEYIIAKFSLEGLLDEESIKIKSAVVNNAVMNLVMEDSYLEDGTRKSSNNLSRIFRIESSDDILAVDAVAVI